MAYVPGMRAYGHGIGHMAYGIWHMACVRLWTRIRVAEFFEESGEENFIRWLDD